MRIALVVTLLLFGLAPALASDGFEPIDIITLEDGSVLRGHIVSEDDTVVVVETSVGRIEVPREQIRLIERMDATGRWDFEGNPDPDQNTIFFTPTPETIGGGAYFRNFLLFFLNWGISIHEDVDLSLGTIVPVSSELASVSGGLKWRLASREESRVGVALLANGTIIDDYRSGSVGAVAGIGSSERSLNVSVARYFQDDGEESTLFLVGGDVRVGGRTKLLAEYGNSSTVLDDDFTGLINVGFRWYGERMSFALTGFRPLEDTGSFLLFPFTMFSMHF